MAYTLANLENDIRNYTEVDSTVFSSAILNPIIKNAENKIYREVDSDEDLVLLFLILLLKMQKTKFIEK